MTSHAASSLRLHDGYYHTSPGQPVNPAPAVLHCRAEVTLVWITLQCFATQTIHLKPQASQKVSLFFTNISFSLTDVQGNRQQ